MSSSHSEPLIFTPEQGDVLADPSRVRIVRAGPGSGKTRVFVAELEKQLASWRPRVGGIAALSFTNVAADEISLRLGGPPPYPHYVGTLDSFVWRFIVRPFTNAVGVTPRGPRLVPAPLDETLERPELKIGAGDRERASLFSLQLQLRDGKACIFHRDPYTNRTIRVDDAYVPKILEAKRREWERNGRFTHADSHAIAWKLLTRSSHATAIIERLAARFPVILLDEFQDTNHFLGRTLLEILRNENIQALVVGDRDQAIFTFGGADKALFRDIESLAEASTHSLRTTHRFGQKIADVASLLARSREAIDGNRSKAGCVLLLEHNSNELQLDARVLEKLKSVLLREDCKTTAFLARRRKWLGIFSSAINSCPLASKAARNLHDAAVHLYTGNSATAVGLVSRLFEDLLLESSLASPEELKQAGIDRSEWRRALQTVLFEAADQQVNETWSAWLLRIRAIVRAETDRFRGSGQADRVGNKFPMRLQKQRTDGLRHVAATSKNPWREDLTIHRAKGREFDGVVIYWPKPGGRARVGCPSDEWWSEDASSEEREIAYVAATRARKVLIFCLHQKTVEALKVRQPDFFNKLELINS